MERPIYEIPVEGLTTPPTRRSGTRAAESAAAPAPVAPAPVAPEAAPPPPPGSLPLAGVPGYTDAAPPQVPGAVPVPSAFAATQAPPPAASAPLNFPPPAFTPPPDAYIDTAGKTSPGPTMPTSGLNPGGGHDGDDPALIAALQAVLQRGASDLHISVNAPPMLRIDGALTPLPGSEPWNADRVTTALRSILTPQQWERFSTDLELDFSFQLSENARFRVNFYQQRLHLGAAFRIIPTEIKPLSELGLPEEIGKLAALPRGLVLITGPTGSGKSTTLAALVEMVNTTRTDHIVTVEDPIEFLYTNKKAVVNQREVGHDTHSFASALKHVLRQDPDVVLIGELRDLETISVALTAAETGHLVFATLHTQDAAQTIDRIIDVFPPYQQNQVRAQLAATLQGVVCQTLLKRMSGSGRVVATEVMFITPAISNLIREGKAYQIPSAMQAGGERGMHTMDQSLAELVNSGTISLEMAMSRVNNYEVLKRLVTRESAIAQPFGQAVYDLDATDYASPGSMGSM